MPILSRLNPVSAAVLAALAVPATLADTRIFNTRPEWQAALSGASVTTESFNALTPQVLAAGTPTPLGAVTVTLTNSTNGTAEIRDGSQFGNIDGSPWFRGFSGILPAASWTFALSAPITAYGADYDSPASGAGIVLVVGSERFTFTHIGSGRGFLGIITDAPFSSLQYQRDPAGTVAAEIWSLDNLAFANTNQPPCLADFNRSGTVTVQDVFDFLVAYFAASPSADINGVGGVTVQDVFDFLVAYFAGCT